MGSVGVEEDAGGAAVNKAAVEAFLERCAPSGDAAYGELRALLARLHDPATRRQARVFLAELRRRQQSDGGGDSGDFFRRFGFRIQELLLHGNPATATATASAFLSLSSSPGNPSMSMSMSMPIPPSSYPSTSCQYVHTAAITVVVVVGQSARATPTGHLQLATQKGELADDFSTRIYIFKKEVDA
jgi:methionine S-methyltransferase